MKNIDLNDREIRRINDLEEDINLLIKSKFFCNSFEEYIDRLVNEKFEALSKGFISENFTNSKLIKPKKYLTRTEIANIIGVENNCIKTWEKKNWFKDVGHLNNPKYQFYDAMTGIIKNCKSSYVIKIREYLQKFDNVQELIDLCEKR